jgi:hypothetical protein
MTMKKMTILAGCIVLIGGNAIAFTGEEPTTEVIAQEKAWSNAVIHHDIAKVASISPMTSSASMAEDLSLTKRPN